MAKVCAPQIESHRERRLSAKKVGFAEMGTELARDWPRQVMTVPWESQLLAGRLSDVNSSVDCAEREGKRGALDDDAGEWPRASC